MKNQYEFQNAYGSEITVTITNGVFSVPSGQTVLLSNLSTNELSGGVQVLDGTNLLALLDFEAMPARDMVVLVGRDPVSGAAFRFEQGGVTSLWIWYVAGIGLGFGLMFFAAKVKALKALVIPRESAD